MPLFPWSPATLAVSLYSTFHIIQFCVFVSKSFYGYIVDTSTGGREYSTQHTVNGQKAAIMNRMSVWHIYATMGGGPVRPGAFRPICNG